MAKKDTENKAAEQGPTTTVELDSGNVDMPADATFSPAGPDDPEAVFDGGNSSTVEATDGRSIGISNLPGGGGERLGTDSGDSTTKDSPYTDGAAPGGGI